MGRSIGVAHDPSVGVRRRHLPALRAGRKMTSRWGRSQGFSGAPRYLGLWSG